VCREGVQTAAGGAAVMVGHADPIKAFWNRFLGQADWRFHLLELDKGGFLELTYDGLELTAITAHSAVLAESPAA